MASRREWIPCSNWAANTNINSGSTSQLCIWGEDELYVPGAADEATFLRLKGHIIIAEETGAVGVVGWRVRVGLDDLQAGGVAATAGDLLNGEVAEEHFLDERWWQMDGTSQPSAGDHPYYYTFDTGSKRKLQSPQALVISFRNSTAQTLVVIPFIRGLFLFA